MKMGKQRSILQRMIRQCGTVQTTKTARMSPKQDCRPRATHHIGVALGRPRAVILGTQAHKRFTFLVASCAGFFGEQWLGLCTGSDYRFTKVEVIMASTGVDHTYTCFPYNLYTSKQNQLRAPPPRNVTRHTLAWPFLSGWSIGYGFELDRGKRMVGERGD